MTSLLLIPLDDTVVFPTMDVTLPVDVGDDERVLLIPRHGASSRRSARSPRSRSASASPAAAAPSRSPASPAASPAPPTRTTPAASASRSRSTADDVPVDGRTRDARARVPRRGRGDPRAARRRRARRRSSCARSSSPARSPTRSATRPTSPSSRRSRCSRRSTSPSAWSSPSRIQRERLVELQLRRKIREDVRRRRRPAAARVLPAQADGVDPARAGRGLRVGRRGVPHQDRRGGHARGRARAGRQGARRGSSAWASSPARPRRSAPTSTGSSPCRGTSAPRRSSTRSHAREVLDADHAGLEDVKDRIVEYLAVKKLRAERGIRGRCRRRGRRRGEDRTGRAPTTARS